MRAFSMMLVTLLVGCVHQDVKGRETLRLAPLRDQVVVPAEVDPVVAHIDAGTDSLTDAELAALERSLSTSLAQAFARHAESAAAKGKVVRRVGTAVIPRCKLRAGPSKRLTVYVARCEVHIVVDGTSVIEAHAEALRRRDTRALSAEEQEQSRRQERNPALAIEDSTLALEAALQGAAHLMVEGALPRPDNAPPALAPLPRSERAALARRRLARGGDLVAALYDLRSAGDPADAVRVTPLLASDDPKVRAAAVEAIGELCAPAATPQIEAIVGDDGEDKLVRAVGRLSLDRLRACGKIAGRP